MESSFRCASRSSPLVVGVVVSWYLSLWVVYVGSPGAPRLDASELAIDSLGATGLDYYVVGDVSCAPTLFLHVHFAYLWVLRGSLSSLHYVDGVERCR